MKTVKAKIKGTNAILEGCVCDDSFFVSVDHDTFERYDLDEVELCESNPNSLTLEEAADKYNEAMSWAWEAPAHPHKAAFIAGAEWQKSQMLKDAIYYVVQDDLDSHGASYNIPFIRIGTTALKPKGIGVGDKVRLIVLKAEEE